MGGRAKVLKVYQYDKNHNTQREAEQQAVDAFRSETGSLGVVTTTLTFGSKYTISVEPYRMSR